MCTRRSGSQDSRTPTALINTRDIYRSPSAAKRASMPGLMHARSVNNSAGQSGITSCWNLIAMRLGSKVTELESLDERHISWIQESLEAFLLVHASESARLRATFAGGHTGSGGGGRLHCRWSRSASHSSFLKTTLKIRLVAPLEQRVAGVSKANGDWPTRGMPPASWKKSTASGFAS